MIDDYCNVHNGPMLKFHIKMSWFVHVLPSYTAYRRPLSNHRLFYAALESHF